MMTLMKNPKKAVSATTSDGQGMTRKALDKNLLRAIYDRAARRYDFMHAFFTGGSDQRGRRILVEQAVRSGDHVLDCGAGTGSTSLLAAEKVGPTGNLVLQDLSEGMLETAKKKAQAKGLEDRLDYHVGDFVHLPFADNSFDVVLSTYSLCPVCDPAAVALELYRVVKPGGKLGIAHSVEPRGRLSRCLAHAVESLIWRFPSLSLGCRPISVLPALEQEGADVVFQKSIGIPLWPFLVFIVQKPQESAKFRPQISADSSCDVAYSD